MNKENAVLVLADGTVVRGRGFGSEGQREGELVFNTSMGGYQEALTDPSYKHQIMLMTYPLIGNYGINKEDFESDRVHAEGLVIRELSGDIGHNKADKTLDEFLRDYSTPGIDGVDTRALTRKIRIQGSMNGILKYPYREEEITELKEKARKLPSISDLDLVSLVSIRETKRYDIKGEKTVVMLDCGAKESVVHSLLERGVNVIRVPAKASVEEIMGHEADGVVVSNGPGDPAKAEYVIKTLKGLISEGIPLFGVCIGLQIIALAEGALTYKLKFGHHGANHPVKDLKTGRIHITSQNHGFAVDAESANDTNLEVTHINLNDQSVEGIKHKEHPIRAVQYHPEANPGPRYNLYLFDEFLEMMK